jgi:hypothetical protein
MDRRYPDHAEWDEEHARARWLAGPALHTDNVPKGVQGFPILEARLEVHEVDSLCSL